MAVSGGSGGARATSRGRGARGQATTGVEDRRRSMAAAFLAGLRGNLAADAGHEKAHAIKVAMQHAPGQALHVGCQPSPPGIECFRLHIYLDKIRIETIHRLTQILARQPCEKRQKTEVSCCPVLWANYCFGMNNFWPMNTVSPLRLLAFLIASTVVL